MKNNYDIYNLRCKSDDIIGKNGRRIYKYEKTFYKNKECKEKTKYNNYPSERTNDSFLGRDTPLDGENYMKTGFLLRSIVCVCMAAGFIFCSLGSSGQSKDVFQTVTTEISKDMTIGEMKDMVVDTVKNLVE